jgi:cytochrome P450
VSPQLIAAYRSHQVFPELYLPIMEIANQWALAPYWMYLPTPQWLTYQSKSKQLDSYMENLIQRRWDRELAQRRLRLASGTGGTAAAAKKEPEDGGTGDFLDRILRLIPEESWNHETMIQLSFELKTFVLAGHETSAAMLTWSLYELSINPSVMQAVKVG